MRRNMFGWAILVAAVLLAAALIGVRLSVFYVSGSTISATLTKMQVWNLKGEKVFESAANYYPGEGLGGDRSARTACEVSVNPQVPGEKKGEKVVEEKVPVGEDTYKVYVWKLNLDVSVTVVPKLKEGIWDWDASGPTQVKVFVQLSSTSNEYYLYYAKCSDYDLEYTDPKPSAFGEGWWSWSVICHPVEDTVVYYPLPGAAVPLADKQDYPTSTPTDIDAYKDALSFPKTLVLFARVSPTVIKDTGPGAWGIEGAETVLIWHLEIYVIAWEKVDPSQPDYQPIHDPYADVHPSSGFWEQYWWVVLIAVLILVAVIVRSVFSGPRIMVVKG